MSTSETEFRFLVFSIGGEQFASPLLSVREVLEYQKPKHMPNMVNYFPGVINVRGAIVGVIDLRAKFGVPATIETRTAMLLCDTEKGAIAAIVDRVESVQEIQEVDIERKPTIKSKIENEYILGVAKTTSSLITVIDLHKSLVEDEYKAA